MSTRSDMNLPGLRLLGRGKVRDLYECGQDLLMVASDRLSAFDVVLPTPIPDKGRVLTQISLFWFDLLRDVVPNHVVSARVRDYPAACQPLHQELAGRSMLVRRLRMFPIECVARGYLSGSGWKEYRQRGTVCGIQLPAGLRESDRLPEPVFTPASKNSEGHDENIAFESVEERIGWDYAGRLRELTLAIYRRAAAHAESRGIILADTKFEFGLDAAGQIVLGDEVLTPDSSRFWPRDGYQPGGPQASFDKQFVRDYLERIGWNKQAPGPELPAEVVERTREKYLAAYKQLTGRELPGEYE